MSSMSNTLNLNDVDAYISKYKLKEVKSSNIFSIGKNTFDVEGLWSETIFGRIGSDERKNKFGYIDLSIKFINPVLYKILRTYSEKIRDILTDKKYYIINDKKELIESDEGETGLRFLCNNFENINFELIAKKEKQSTGVFIEKNKKLIFIDKYLIIPPGGIRDMSTDIKKIKQFMSEINDIYQNLIQLTSQLKLYLNDDNMLDILSTQIQKGLLNSYTWIQNRMQGKTGIFRQTMLKKSMDFSSRIIATSDPNIELGYIGIPWHTLLAIFEPHFINYVLKKDDKILPQIRNILDLSEDHNIGYHNLKSFIYLVIKNPNEIKDPLLTELKEIIEIICKDKHVLCKRDPVTARSRYYTATPTLVNNRGAVVNPLTCGAQGLDFDGDQLSIVSLFSEEANENAKNMNPAKSKSVWITPNNSNSIVYKLADDAISTIYSATKD